MPSPWFPLCLTAQSKQTELKTPVGKFALEVTAEYLGMAGPNTVVENPSRFAGALEAAASRGVRSFAGELRGSFTRGKEMVQAFRYPVAGDVMDGKMFTYSFLRAVPPGSYRLKLVVTDPSGREVGEGAVDLSVPEVGIAFRPELAPGEADTLPEAEAIVIADEGGPRADAETGESKLKILPPSREAPVGLLRLEAQVEPPITRVEFYLGDSSCSRARVLRTPSKSTWATCP